MWSRATLKSNAKQALQPYYWYGVLVCFIAGILGASFSGGSAQTSFKRFTDDAPLSGAIGVPGESLNPSYLNALTATMILMTVFLIISAIVLVLTIFVGNIVLVGKLNYFLESRYQGQSAGVGRLFFGFSGGHYLNVLKCMFLRDLFTFLWSLLFVIPGIYKHYEYYMVPYLLSEYPDMDRREAFQRSKEMMDGNKLDTWVLELSFIGWYLLGSLLCGIGIFFVNPYYEATFVELYLNLKAHTYGGRSQSYDNVVN